MKKILFEDKVGSRTISLSMPVYEAVREFIMRVLMEKGEITFIELLNLAEKDSSLRLEGDVNWCFLVVKRDLAARGIIHVTIGLGRSRVQLISLSQKKRSTLASIGYY